MLYLLAIFISPLALLLVGKWFQAILNLVLYVLAIVLVVTYVFAFIGVGVWLAAVIHAVLAINSHKSDKRHQALLDAVSKKTP
jgi:tetrahydromethanopterin S-methyltransferase subunit E